MEIVNCARFPWAGRVDVSLDFARPGGLGCRGWLGPILNNVYFCI